VFFQKDYVLRMIEMMGDLMRRVGEMLNDLERFRLLSDACREHCGMDLKAAEKLSLESLIELLSPHPRWVMSEIFYIQAMKTSLAPEERELLLYRSVRLLLSLKSDSLLCELRSEKLRECLREAKHLLTSRDQMDSAAFFIQAEQFDHGEDALFTALNGAAPEEYAQFLAEGEGLMQTCLLYPRARLSAGGLPYEEVKDCLQSLQRRQRALKTYQNGAGS